MPKRRPAIDRFVEKFSFKETGCWEWNACRNNTGYGQFYNGDHHVLAHRWSYEYHVKPIPEDKIIDHLCRNPACVNPQHLECVSMKTNTERGYLYHVFAAKAAIKTHCKRGHPLSGDNLRIDSRGDRCCVTCQCMKAKEWKVRNRKRVNQVQQARRAATPRISKSVVHRVCPHCGTSFAIKRSDQQYCCSYCVKTAWRKRYEIEETAA